jgi:hypothetical protein
VEAGTSLEKLADLLGGHELGVTASSGEEGKGGSGA